MFEVRMITPGFYWIQGCMPENTLADPDVANAFIVEHADDVYLIDTGVGPAFKHTLLDFFQNRNYHNFTLITTHWHVDHICNNDVIEEIKTESKQHLIHPKGKEYLNVSLSVMQEALETSKEYFPADFSYSSLRALNFIGPFLGKVAPKTFFKITTSVMFRKFQPVNNKTSVLRALSLTDCRKFRFGSIELSGWECGHLILIDDGAHSPDSLVIYDPSKRILLMGDLTYEFNPLWRSDTYQKTITNLLVYRALVKEGFVEILGDSHNHQLFQGAEQILILLDGLIATHERRRNAIIEISQIKGISNIERIRNVLSKNDLEFADLVSQKEFPLAYRSTRAMIAVALSESLQISKVITSRDMKWTVHSCKKKSKVKQSTITHKIQGKGWPN